MVWFDGISTIVGYLMPNYPYTYILNMISKHILFMTFLNESELSFLFLLLNGSTYFYLIWLIQFTITHSFAHS